MKNLFFTVFATFVIFSCKNKNGSQNRFDTTEIYDTKGSGNSIEANALQYYETSEYKGNRKIIATYYNTDGSVKGKEKFENFINDSLPSSSSYYDADNKKMSYYKFVYNDQGEKIATFAFDASNHELLKVERFYYKEGRLVNKVIHTSTLRKEKTIQFAYDQYGNESAMQVLNEKDSIIVNENYTISKKDDKNLWVERWGSVNGKPVTYYKRKK
jgi:hypothetical protein